MGMNGRAVVFAVLVTATGCSATPSEGVGRGSAGAGGDLKGIIDGATGGSLVAGLEGSATGGSGGQISNTDAAPNVLQPNLPPCASRMTDDILGVFVSTMGSDTPNCGARLTGPCRSVQYGIDVAAGSGRTKVFVGPGIYTESVTLKPAMRVEGGWDILGTTWSPNCTPTANATATIQAPP